MESLNASTLSVVLKVREGAGFGFLTSPFIIVCSLNGNSLTSDPIPCSPNPSFESDFIWEADKKVLRSMRSHNYSIRVECFSDAKFRRSDKIGYILLNMKHRAQIVSPTLGTNVKFQWHKLLGVRHDAKSYKPEIYLSLFITEADADIDSKIPKPPQPVAPVAAVQEDLNSNTMIVTTNAQPMEGLTSKIPVQVGSPRETDVLFKFSVKITSVHNLDSFINEENGVNDLRLEFALFGDCFKTNDLSSCQGEVENEFMTMIIKSQVHSLTAYFAQFPYLYFLLQSSGQTITKTPFDMKSFITQEKCESLLSGKVTSLDQVSNLQLENTNSDACSYFTLSVALEVDKSKVKNPVKPFTVATNIKKFEKADENLSTNKSCIRSISCKTKTNAVSLAEEEHVDDSKNTNIQPAPSSQEIKIVENGVKSENPDPNILKKPTIRNGCFKPEDNCFNEADNMQKMWANTNAMKNIMDYQQNCNNASSQNLPQFAYPYSQPNFPGQNFAQDGRGDTLEMFGKQTGSDMVEKVKAQITQDLAKKTYEELEEWKEKQKDHYKSELKKKLDKEIKKLTSEWLSKQNELEKEATMNIEESVSLSQQLHTTSAELKIRLESVTRQQLELEKEKEGLEKTFADKHQELREASKKHQASLQQQINKMVSEIGELKAKNCSLLKENEILRNTQQLGGGDSQIPLKSLVYSKSSHLTEQQMTALLIDMKSLEEKLKAALESKEFFRKEWSRALREIHRMKTEQEEQVRLQLQAQRQELDNLRLVGLITADEKSSKDDLASLKELRSQIVHLKTPKSS